MAINMRAINYEIVVDKWEPKPVNQNDSHPWPAQLHCWRQNTCKCTSLVNAVIQHCPILNCSLLLKQTTCLCHLISWHSYFCQHVLHFTWIIDTTTRCERHQGVERESLNANNILTLTQKRTYFHHSTSEKQHGHDSQWDSKCQHQLSKQIQKQTL
jgi:hypothetical protein